MNKNLKLTVAGLIFSSQLIAQQPVTNTSPGPLLNGVGSNQFWSRAGNNNSSGQNNIFGTMWNSPIYTYTNAVSRMKLNGSFAGASQYAINAYAAINTSGYLLLGENSIGNTISTNPRNLYNQMGAFSLLHLNGRTPNTQEYGYRPWMQTGITLTDNQDLSYLGLRKVGTGIDFTETVLGWSDNNVGSGITDEMTFRFFGFQGGNTTIENTTLSPDDLDGLHIARYTPNGRYGLGSDFGLVGVPGDAAAGTYITPQSLQHMSYPHRAQSQFEPYGFLQQTYRFAGLGGGETAFDGLRLGIDESPAAGSIGISGFLRWQEQTPFVVQTDWDNGAGGIDQGERMRVSSAGAPNVTNGIYNIQDNVTRVGINYLGTTPIINPRALLHLGRDISGTEYAGSFMDYGTLVDDGTRALFTGITPPTYSDPLQSVLSFGGKDMVFIEANDREVARFTKSNNNMGIGDFSPTGLIMNSTCPGPPSERIDVEGNARLRNVPSEASEYLMLGKRQCTANANDIAFRKLAFPNDPTLFLDGTGNWAHTGGLDCWDLNNNGVFDVATEDFFPDGIADSRDCRGATGATGGTGPTGSTEPAGTNGTNGTNGADGLTIGAHNGTSMSTLDNTKVAFGQNIAQPGNPGKLLLDREVPLDNKTIDFKGEGTIHISQSGNVLNNNASLDVNNQSSTNTIGINFIGNTNNNLVNQKGIYAQMNVLTTSPTNNSAVIEATNTHKFAHAAGWIIKANGFYGTNGAGDLLDQASFGVLGNGNVMVNGNLTNLDNTKANLVVNDFAGSSNTGVDGHRRSMYITNTNPTGSVNYGLDVLATNDAASTFGIQSVARGTNNSSNVTAITAESFTDNTTNSVGKNVGVSVNSHSLGALPQNFGVDIDAIGSATRNTALYANSEGNSSIENVGVDAVAAGSSAFNYGVKGKTGNGGMKNYGIHGAAAGGSQANYSIYGDVSTGATDPLNNYAGFFKGRVHIDGDLDVVGNIHATGTITPPSDQMFKTNVQELVGAMSLIKQLKPKTYYFDTSAYSNFAFESDLQIGLIAQDLVEIIPSLVSSHTRPAEFDSLGAESNPALFYKGVEYLQLIPLLIAGAQEQDKQLVAKDSIITAQQVAIEDLNTRLARLESCLSALLPTLCEMNQSAVQQTPQEVQTQLKQKLNVTLSNRNTLVLSQNVPNPFAESTVIEYSIPESVKKAQIHFYDGNGQLINSVDIVERGNGELTVFANDLSTGIYTYSLVADGKVVASKKMMKK